MCRITTKAPYGQRIRLTCKNHPELEWSTKNIGSTRDGKIYRERSIFFDLWHADKEECSCPGSDLSLHPSYADLPDVPE